MALGKLSNKVNSIAFAPDSSYLITCGDRHLKWWYIQQEGSKIDMSGKPASILEVLRMWWCSGPYRFLNQQLAAAKEILINLICMTKEKVK